MSTKQLVADITSGNLSAALDSFSDVMADKQDQIWSATKMDFARTAFDSPEEEQAEE
jgi:hypothetical protein